MSRKPTKPLHARLSSARGLLIEWRNTLRHVGPSGDGSRTSFAAEISRFDEAIKAVAEARDAAKGRTS